MTHFSAINLDQLTFEPVTKNQSGGKSVPIRVAKNYLQCQLAYPEDPIFCYGLQNTEENKISLDKKNMSIPLSSEELKFFFQKFETAMLNGIEKNSVEYYGDQFTIQEMIKFKKIRKVLSYPKDATKSQTPSVKVKVILTGKRPTKFYKAASPGEDGIIDPVECQFEDIPKGKREGETIAFKCIPFISIPSLYNVSDCMGASIRCSHLIIIEDGVKEFSVLSKNGNVSKIAQKTPSPSKPAQDPPTDPSTDPLPVDDSVPSAPSKRTNTEPKEVILQGNPGEIENINYYQP